MAASTNPPVSNSNAANFLPRIFRTDTNKKFFQATIDQLTQPGTVKKINGFIGRQNSKATTGDDIFIAAADASRQNYQLEPGLVIKDDLNNTTFFKDYQDYINQLGVFGANTLAHARLNEQEFYSWDPHIDWDKFVNFQNYYWLPYGPDTIKIYGQSDKIISTYTVEIENEGDSNEYLFTPNGLSRNPTITLYRGQTYKFEINSPNNPFSIKTHRSSGNSYQYIVEGIDKTAVEVGTITVTLPHNSPDVLYYQSEGDPDLGGVIHVLSIEENSHINVETEIVGKKTYVLSNGTSLSNGMKVSFGGSVLPAAYATSAYYVEGVGTSITLINETVFELVGAYTTSTAILFDTMPFDKAPFSDATAYAGSPDYLVINRASNDHNPWSRYNRWFHKEVIEQSALYNGTSVSVDQTSRAVRAIIEFEANIRLFNFGTLAIADVELIDNFTTDVFSTIEGAMGYNIDGIDLIHGQTIIFTADTDRFVTNKIFKVEFIDFTHTTREGKSISRQIHLVEVESPTINAAVLIHRGYKNQGEMYWFDGTGWKLGQQKTKLNQPPLFDVVDADGVSFGNIESYIGSTFVGSKIFSYKEGTGTIDPNLGFALSYKNIGNIGDIVFNFNLCNDQFRYESLTTVIDKTIDTGYLEKTNYDGSTGYVNGWKTSTVSQTQAAIRIYSNSNLTSEFNIDIFDIMPTEMQLYKNDVRVYINAHRVALEHWALETTPEFYKVVFKTPVAVTDVITIKVFSATPINGNGYYEIPINLQNNPLNETISSFTLGEVIDHVSSIIDNIYNHDALGSDSIDNNLHGTVSHLADSSTYIGVFPGVSNLRDLGNITQYGTRFVQHSGPHSLSMYHITSQNNNVIRAIEKSQEDYNKFKRNFITIASTMGVDTDPVSHVNLILREINKDNPNTFPYYFSDMLAYGANIKTVLSVVDYRTKTYPLSNVFNLDELSTKAVNVYHNDIHLLYGKDYTFSTHGFIIISSEIADGDQITIYEYESTDGSFIPETPTKLGIWPKYEPQIFTDNSLITPRTMIQGHDGSVVLAYDDYRDDLVLELEKRIYNNIKVRYDADIFDIHSIIPSYTRKTPYSLHEFNDIIAPSFYKWTSLVGQDFTKAYGYDIKNSFTYNYIGNASLDGREVPGYWRGIYRWMLDTDRPNMCPWEMLGLTESPKWWTELYGPAPYTSDNLILWQDIADGLLREPGRPPITLPNYAKPFLMNHIPVDENGKLISPLDAGLATGVFTTVIRDYFKFGDVGPVESAWRRSSHYPFSVLLAAMLSMPAKTFGVLLDRSRIIKNIAGQLVYKDTGLRVQPKSILIPSIQSSQSRIQTAGIINYIANYILSDNLKYYADYKKDLSTLTARLSHRIGAYTSKEKFHLLLDAKTPLADGNVFVPPENYEIILNSSSPIKKITYSGVIITKLPDGFEINGYSRTHRYFKYYNWTHSGHTVNIGGISESYLVWARNQQYAVGKVVRYDSSYYRVQRLHTTLDYFEDAYYIKLIALPMLGGRSAIIRKLWDRTDPITLPYNTRLQTPQEVVDFLLGYGEYLKDQGFIFDDFNSTMGQVTNWEASSKEFLFWTTQNWSTGEDKWDDWLPGIQVNYDQIVQYNGDYYRAIRNSKTNEVFNDDDFVKLDGLSNIGSSVLTLSPSAGKLTFKSPLSVVDDIRNKFNGYEIFRVDGQPLAYNYINSYRENNAVSYTPVGKDGIFGATFYLVQREQIVILDNTTLFNDTIYSPASGYRQERIKVAGYVSTDWHGAFDIPGFIFDQAVINDWSPWQDYDLGDIVRHTEFYYSASKFTPGVEIFNYETWIKLDKKPTPKLLPNWNYAASQFEDFYSLDSDNFDIGQQKVAQHLVGYQKRQYLANIIQDDVSEFKFFQGMIVEKGTQNVFNKLFDVLSSEGTESLKFYEEWAIRAGQYGANAAYENIEFVLDESLFKNNPQGFELVNISDPGINDFIVRQTPTDVYVKPIGYNSSPWPLLENDKSYLRSAGHVRADEVLMSVKSIDDILSQDISLFTNGDYVWCSFDTAGWNVYRYTDANMTVINVTKNDNNNITITTTSLVSLPVGTVIGIRQVSGFTGFYKISSVSLNAFTVAASSKAKVPLPFIENDTIIIYAMKQHRAYSIDDIDNILPTRLKESELLWTDDNGYGKWSTWIFKAAYDKQTVINQQHIQNMHFGRAQQINYAGNLLVVSSGDGYARTYDRASSIASTGWIGRQSIPAPYLSPVGLPTNDVADVARVIAISPDSRWMATGSPNLSYGAYASSTASSLNIIDPSNSQSTLVNHGGISLYEKDVNNVYTLLFSIASPTPTANDFFGTSLAFGGNCLYIGSTSGTGRVHKMAYTREVKASASYNPVGSSGTSVHLSTVDGIAIGMTISGIGFTSGQTVTGINTMQNTVILTAAPEKLPSGICNFSIVAWKYSLGAAKNGTIQGSGYGSALTINNAGSVLLVSASGAYGTPGQVFVYKNDILIQTIVGQRPYFGIGMTVSANCEYIAISDILSDGVFRNQGSVSIYNYDGITLKYKFYQELIDTNPEVCEYFGSKLLFTNDYKTLVVYSKNSDTQAPWILDDNTRFDDSTTVFMEDQNLDSGVISVYNRYASKWVFSEALETSSDSNDRYGDSISAGANSIIVAAPGSYDGATRTGVVYEYYKSADTYSWEILHSEINKTDVTKIKQAFLYDKETNQLLTYIDILDPLHGKIPGIADQEITYKVFYDPAVYSVGDSSVSVDDGVAWKSLQVGTLWWDLRTAKFVISNSDDIVYRNSTWNTLATGASIDVYEWVATPRLPADWNALADTSTGLALSISGTTLYDNTVYSIHRTYDNISETYKNTYYYWVKNKKTIPSINGRHMSAMDVSQLIGNPRGAGYQYLVLSSENSFSLVNIKPLLKDVNVVLSVEYWMVDKTDQNIHTQWKIISDDITTTIPEKIETKWIDSLCGKDVHDRLVPDNLLPLKLRYGIEDRPRQGMFINRFESLKQYVEYANLIMIKYLITESRDLTNLNSYEPEPSKIRGLYDSVVDTDLELRFANIGSFSRPTITINAPENGRLTSFNIVDAGRGYINAPIIEVVGSGKGANLRTLINVAGQVIGIEVLDSGIGYTENTKLVIRDYSVLVHSDAASAGVWSIYSYDPTTHIWSRVKSQTYNTTRYWNYIDWYATGYNKFSAITHAVDTYADLNTIYVNIGELVKIRITNLGTWVLLKKYADVQSIDWTQTYRIVGSQRGTIQISSSLYKFTNSGVGYDNLLYDNGNFDNSASTELRIILDAMKNDIFIGDLRSAYLHLFYTCVRYILNEQTYVDWIFKTSFVKATHNVGELRQPPTFRNDNLTNYEDFVSEVKPYRTKVREYISAYAKLETNSTSISDFDLPPIYDNKQPGLISVNIKDDNEIEADSPAIHTYPWKHWFDSVGFSITAIALVDAGSGYTTAPIVEIKSNSGTGATARAFIANGKLSRVVLLTPGKGYLSAPVITLNGGLPSPGTPARVIAIIGAGVVRSSLIKMKFDRITKTYFITQLQETEHMTGSGSRRQFSLVWAPDVRIGTTAVTINGVSALRTNYNLRIVTSTTHGYTSYSGVITFDVAPAKNAEISVTYLKDWSILNAADRIQYYYDPQTGDLGKDLAQLMTGVDYGGVVINGLGFDVSRGWDSIPYNMDKWDSVDPTFEDYIVTVSEGTHTLTLPYVPPKDTLINVYYNNTGIDSVSLTGVWDGYDEQTTSVNFSAPDISTGLLASASVVMVGGKIVNILMTEKGSGYLTRPTVYIADSSNPSAIYGTATAELTTFIRVDDSYYGTSLWTMGSYAIGDTVRHNDIYYTAKISPTSSVFDEIEWIRIGAVVPAAVMPSWKANGISQEVNIPDTFIVEDASQFILRKPTSDGAIPPQDDDYDTAISGGDLAYITATGLAADDIIIDGDGFVTPTSSDAPEEVVPGQVVDALAIKVYDRPSSGSAAMAVDNYVADGDTVEFLVTNVANSPAAILVKVTDGVTDEIKTSGIDYNFEYATSTITFKNPPTIKSIVSIFSIGINGANILDVDNIFGTGDDFEILTKAPWINEMNSLVYVNNEIIPYELVNTAGFVSIKFIEPPLQTDLIHYIIASGVMQSFAISRSEKVVVDGRPANQPYNLNYIIGDSYPIESNMIVRVDQTILNGPSNSYFVIKNNKLTYAIDHTKFAPHSVDISEITVFANGVKLDVGADYIVNLGVISIKLSKAIYAKYANAPLTISIITDQEYTYIQKTATEPAKILFKASYGNQQIVEIFSSYNHDTVDMQRTTISPILETPEIFYFTDMLGGIIRLDRSVINDNYIWVIKNGRLLTHSIDYKLNDGKTSITLVADAITSDIFTIMTYGSNIVVSTASYMQFKDMLNRTHFKRLSLNKQAILVNQLNWNDTSILVDDASNFDLPNPPANKPGIIEIRGERIEYFEIYQNLLSKLRRGTLGTGTPSIHPAGAYVQDIGTSETIPYFEKSTIEQIVSTGSLIVPITMTPTSVGVAEWFIDIGYKLREKYSPTTQYAKNEVVSYDNYYYVCIKSTSLSTLAPLFPAPNNSAYWKLASSIPVGYGQTNDIEVFVGGYDITIEWAPNVMYSVGTIVIVGSYTHRCVTAHTSGANFSNDSAKWAFFIGNIRLKKKPYKVHNVNINQDSPAGDIIFDADFSVNGISKTIRLSNKLTEGTLVTIVKRTGTEWDSAISIQKDTSKIADFIKAVPGSWYNAHHGIATTLTANLTLTATTITVESTSGFPIIGVLRLATELEQISYTGKTATTFTGCTRGANNTTAAAHVSGTSIRFTVGTVKYTIGSAGFDSAYATFESNNTTFDQG